MDKDQIKSKDNFSKTITLSFNGEDAFTTLLGGITSILIKAGVLVIAILMTLTIIQRGNTSTSINKIVKDTTNDPDKHYFAN